MVFPTCIEVARKYPGSMDGAQNTTSQLGSFLSGVLFGYVARISGSYDRPLMVMVLVLIFGALMWLKIDPTRELVPEVGQPLPPGCRPPTPNLSRFAVLSGVLNAGW
jgi:hypothetical protein